MGRASTPISSAERIRMSKLEFNELVAGNFTSGHTSFTTYYEARLPEARTILIRLGIDAVVGAS